MATLEAGVQYGLRSNFNEDDACMFVKLTDSALRHILNYFRNQVCGVSQYLRVPLYLSHSLSLSTFRHFSLFRAERLGLSRRMRANLPTCVCAMCTFFVAECSRARTHARTQNAYTRARVAAYVCRNIVPVE